jgi:cellulose synthase/poly-beta-1,6-N-acetylglucosamine synthase-like glycosyltransferase
MEMPTVSVVVPNYNHARFLPKRIGSILCQTYQDFELILLDDYSTDDSRAILSQYTSDPRVRLEFNQINSGSTFKQWNKGARLARGKYVWLAESDDYADERLLEKLIGRLEADPSAVFCYCRSWRVSDDGQLNGYLDSCLSHLDAQKWTADFSVDGREECRKYLVRFNTVLSASSVVFRKDVYREVGGADEKLRFCGDWKMWASMALTGGRVCYLGEPLNYGRYHAGSVTTRSWREATAAAEIVHVTGWILERVSVDHTMREKVCEDLSRVWSQAVLNRRFSASLRWAILKDAMTIDHAALGRLVRPTLTALRMTLARRWRSLRAA